MKSIYQFGRLLQVLGLLMMPSAVWIAEFRRSEQGAIAIFIGSLITFFVGWVFTRVR